MKTEYPDYSNGDLIELENKMPIKSRKLLYDFVDVCKATAGDSKVEKVKRHLVQFYDVTETNLDQQSKDTVNAFLVVLNRSNRSGWTKHEIKVYVKKFLKWHYHDLDMIENIKSSKREKMTNITENDLITESEFSKMLEKASNYRDKSLLTLLYEAGARPQEILNLHWNNIHFDDDHANLTFHSDKTGESRTFPVVRSKEFLWYYKQEGRFMPEDLVFPSPYNESKPITTVGVNKMIRILAEKAGIQKKVWIYLFRHSRATRLYEELPQPICEKLLGHKNMAHIYAHISDKKAKSALLSKIYKIEQLPEDKRIAMEKEIATLKQQLADQGQQFERAKEDLKKETEEVVKNVFKKMMKDVSYKSELDNNLSAIEVMQVRKKSR